MYHHFPFFVLLNCLSTKLDVHTLQTVKRLCDMKATWFNLYFKIQIPKTKVKLNNQSIFRILEIFNFSWLNKSVYAIFRRQHRMSNIHLHHTSQPIGTQEQNSSSCYDNVCILMSQHTHILLLTFK
jgi:hypothetical protein